MEIDDIKDLLTDDEYCYFGHGVKGKNNEDVVNSIFEQGLRTKDRMLYWTSVALQTENWDECKELLDNWQHEDAKKIILMRLPKKYVCNDNASSTVYEVHHAFYIEHLNGKGEIENYVDPIFVVGCYDADLHSIRMNPSFELELPEGTIERLEKRYEEARRLAHDRIKLRSRKITDESAYEMEMEGSDVDFDSFDDDWLENDENSIEGTDLGKQSIVEQEDTMAKDDTENHLEEHLRINTITQQTYKEQP